MKYPNLNGVKIHSLLSSDYQSNPAMVDLSNKSDLLQNVDPQDQLEIDKRIFDYIASQNTNWGLSGYLEDRRILLSPYPQMVEQERYYHLGLDVIVLADVPLYAPLDGTVVASEYEPGAGNYGALVLLKHEGEFETFYSFYGHLQKSSLPQLGQKINAGQEFARTGEIQENGNWFYHTHLQVLTQKGLDEGWMHKGYCTKEQIPTIHEYCPDPKALFPRP